MTEANQILTHWYLGERGGHALFSLLAHAAEPAVAHKWSSLALIEERVAERLQRVLASRSVLVPPHDGVQLHARQRCNSVARQTWTETMQWLLATTEAALQQIQGEANYLPVELSETGDFVVRHELALRSFAERELHDGGADSLLPVHEFLAASPVGD